ncbi:hypothetical protein ACLQ3D_05925 [Micromonospora vinacea]|uniref:HEAT repeat domain-containing protein n=1 Tax=Micromonospora vinacea TaxID=709878 RepID=A0ABS0K3R2_9ACTN|nr:hypothetical protein [Micromonospora vinacea]MBG6103200.1 hypothetical protein [Micromonospora vinacea]WTA69462.1 hypothetical protein OHB51_10055 [Micromonospora sp. NBC_00855]
MSAGRFERYDRYERALRDVLKILNLAAPPAPSGDARNDPRARRHWQCSVSLLIMRAALPPQPEELFEPLVLAAVYEPDPSHTQWHIRPALAAFGRRRVQTRLLEHLRTGTDYEIIGAADAWYCTYLRVAGSDTEDDRCTDLRHTFQEVGLHIFLANDNPRVRRAILTLLNLRANESPPELRPLVSEVLHIVRAHAG